ncbi:MAG: NYN domain-containing protein [Calditrichaeota bacterium]|nr:MAG: NYN domain-containing protein [Calditrichota bacterium]
MNVRDIKLREWVAFLQAKTGNLPAAEEMFEQIRKRKDTKQNFYTDWNLAVMAYDRKDEAMAYQFLVPLLDQNAYDEDLIWIVLALAIKLEDRERFLATIPKSLTMRFHPLAIVVSYNFGDQSRTQELLGEFLRQTSWQLPPVNRRFNNLAELEKIIDEGIVEGQIEQLVSWLEARIVSHKGWIPNYLALARVYEEECQDVENAFKILRNRLRIVQNDNKQDKRKKDDACRDLLELCKRNKYKKLGEQAFQLAIKACTSKDLLNSFKNFAPKENEAIVDQAKPDPPPQIVTPLRQTDPQLAERLAWVTARFASVRNIATYVEEQKALDQFVRIVTEMNPEESGSVVDKINNISTVVQRFFSTEVGDHDARRVLYTRAIGFEESLTKLLNSGVLSQNLTDIITPYHAALKKVLGDLSRQAGIGPKIDVVIENPFISNETEKSTLVIKATNESQRQVSDVQIELLADNSILNIAGNKNSIISNLNSQQSAFINFPIRCNGMKSNNGSSNIPVDISIQASAEGFPNVDLGIIKRRIPIKTFKEFIGAEQIPKKFQKVALNPSEPDLFQGRDDIMKKIKNSFSGGIQRERYFLDGIRRTGKTSILNFLPRSLPENVIPVLINLDTFGLTAGPIDSPSFLHGICGLMCESMMSGTNNGNEIHPPDKEAFVSNPGQAFNQFLTDFKTKTDGKVPLLMIDEFQTLLEAIARTGSGINRDTLVLDQLRGHLDQGNLYATMTGSVRFDRLSQITDHRIFGSLTRLRVTFLAEESVKQVLHAGLEQWVKIPDETVRKVYQLTGGYPWLIQDYGANLVDLLNDEHRTIATEKDIELITEESILCNNEHFKHWWPTNQLSSEEERFIEELFRKYPDQENVETREFFGSIHHREQPAFRRAFENLRACEVLDSTQTEKLSFRGTVLRRWLEQQIQSDGRLRIRVDYQEKPNTDRGKTGVFIDHENLIKSLERISAARGKTYSKNKLDWFSHILKNLLSEAENRVGMLGFKVAVAFWNRPEESNLQSAYFDNGFTPAQPENVKLENAVDFKVADEVRRANEQAMREKTWLSRAIIVTGDGDLSHIVRALVNDRVAVQVWAGSKETSNQYQKIVGEENIVALDDVCGL